MKNTPIVRFGNLYSIPSSNGLSRPSAVRGSGFKMINMGELFANNIITDLDMERVQMSESEQQKFFVEEGDLLFARQSLVAEGAGKCSIVKKFSEPTTFESHLIRVRLNKEICNPWYYYYLFQLKSNPIKSIINQCAQAGIRGSELLNVKVPNPPISIQNKIANILSRYDEAIENNNKRIKLLEQMTQNLYKEWFVRFRFPGWQNAEFENGIPKGWHQGRLSELLEFKRGKNITADEMEEGEVPVISAGLEPSGYHNEANVKGTSLTISSSGANAGYLSIHYENIWAADCMFISENKTKNIYYVYELLNNIRPVIINQQRGAAQPHVYSNDINHLKLWIPNLELMEKANKLFESLHKEIYNLQQANINLSKQRDLLLPRLMSGKLEVK